MTTPQHPQAIPALARAAYLADVYQPATEAQQVAHQRLVEAIRAGDLYRTVEAMKAASHKSLATEPWAAWAEVWVSKVRQIILDEVEQEKGRAA